MNTSAYIALFGAGIASFLNPCVLPLVPAYLGMITGTNRRASQSELLGATVLFVAGFTAVFAGLGLVAETLGRNIDAMLGDIQRVGGVIVICLGLIQFGAIPRLRATSGRLRSPLLHSPLLQPVVLGVTFGTAWTPCVGPLLGAALVTAGRSSTKTQGIALLATYAMGVGVPFVATSLALDAAPSLTKRLRLVGRAAHHLAGVTLIVLGLLLATDRYNALTSVLARLVPTVRWERQHPNQRPPNLNIRETPTLPEQPSSDAIGYWRGTTDYLVEQAK